MSSDTGIYILTTPKGNGFEYRVDCKMAVENYQWDDEKKDYTDDPKIQIKNARALWSGCKVHTNEDDAMRDAVAQYKEYGYTEYGIQFININAEF